jgi:hypothetical protein
MICSEIDNGMLRSRLDGELSAPELARVNQHLEDCAECRARFHALSSEMESTRRLLTNLENGTGEANTPALAYAHFQSQHATRVMRSTPWLGRIFAPGWRPAWGVAATVVLVAMLVGVSPMRIFAQRMLALLRVQKIAVISIDPETLLNSAENEAHPYKLINQFLADNVVITQKPGNSVEAGSIANATQMAGFPVRYLGSMGAPQSIQVSEEASFHMTLNRQRLEALLEEVGRTDIRVPESANGALISVHIPKIVVSMYGDCPARHKDAASEPQSRAEALAQRKIERMSNLRGMNCTYFIQAPSPTVSVPPDLNMSQIAEAALELAGMNTTEARSFCQTIDWSSTLVVPIPHSAGTYQKVTVDAAEGTLITEGEGAGRHYSLLWIKNGVIDSLAGRGDSGDALALAGSLQ